MFYPPLLSARVWLRFTSWLEHYSTLALSDGALEVFGKGRLLVMAIRSAAGLSLTALGRRCVSLSRGALKTIALSDRE